MLKKIVFGASLVAASVFSVGASAEVVLIDDFSDKTFDEEKRRGQYSTWTNSSSGAAQGGTRGLLWSTSKGEDAGNHARSYYETGKRLEVGNDPVTNSSLSTIWGGNFKDTVGKTGGVTALTAAKGYFQQEHYKTDEMFLGVDQFGNEKVNVDNFFAQYDGLSNGPGGPLDLLDFDNSVLTVFGKSDLKAFVDLILQDTNGLRSVAVSIDIEAEDPAAFSVSLDSFITSDGKALDLTSIDYIMMTMSGVSEWDGHIRYIQAGTAPEPSSIVLLGLGGILLILRGRRRIING